MKKLLLINPVGRKSGYLLSRFTTFEPLSLAYVAAVTPESWEIQAVDENFDRFEFVEADLVAITAFTSSINRAYEIAGVYREKGIKVIIGGIHASLVPDEVAEYADTVVIGEVEEIWGDVLNDFENNRLKPIYKAELVDFNALSVKPRRDVLHPSYFWSSVQTSRGCPFDCAFCSVSRYLGREFRQRDIEDVLEELSEIKGTHITFTDDNLIGYRKDNVERAKRLFRGMIERGLNKKWWMQTSINAVDDEEAIQLAAEAGCMFVFVGFESINNETLKSMGKGANITIGVDNYRKVIDKFHKYGIGVIGGFIVGNDYESSNYYREFARFLLHSQIDVYSISLLTPLPGTRFFEEMEKENRLIHDKFPKDWKKYRLSRLVHRPKGISIEGVYCGDNHIKKILYAPLPYVFRMLRSLFQLRNISSFMSVIKLNRALHRSWKNSYYYKNFSADLKAERYFHVQEELFYGEQK